MHSDVAPQPQTPSQKSCLMTVLGEPNALFGLCTSVLDTVCSKIRLA
jgi:hypothetical protein